MSFRKMIQLSLVTLFLVAQASCGGGGNGSGNGGGIDLSAVHFDLKGAIGLAIDNTPRPSSLAADGSSSVLTNLKRVNADNSLSDAISSGAVTVQSFMVAANNQVYLLLSSYNEDSCVLVRVDGETNEATCVDSTLEGIAWGNPFGDPIQFDGEGNVYYQGYTNDGHTVLRRNSSGVATDLINDQISLKGFIVLTDGNVMITGNTGSTEAQWTRIVSPSGALTGLLDFVPNFMFRFPDNNVYMQGNGFALSRYLTAIQEFDPIGWIGNTDSAYFICPSNCYYNYMKDHILRTSDGKVYIENGQLTQYYPVVAAANTTVSKVTISKGILTYILLAGLDSDNHNRLVLYDTDNDTETDLLGSEEVEVYHINYLNSGDHQIVMFDGLRFSDNRYVLCQVDLTDDNALTCSLTETGKLTDLQLFDDANSVAGGGTNTTLTYTIGGTVKGLYGTLVLKNISGDTITLTHSGPFTFPVAVAGDYKVTVQNNPLGQSCSVSKGIGTVTQANVNSVAVSCVTHPGVIVTVAGGGEIYPSEGAYATMAGGVYPGHIALSAAGDLFYSDNAYSVNMIDGDGIITRVAGSGDQGFFGDGGPGTSARFNDIGGLAIDSFGNLFIADRNNNRIRKVDIHGIVTTVAGNGASGFSGDGGAATSAKLYYPEGLAIDSSDNLFISDSGNYRIRKVDTHGIITTVAGNGTQGFSGDGGAATSAKLNGSVGLAIDSSDNLYVADEYNYRVRKIDTNGIITTVAGNGNSDFSGDGGPATSAGLSSISGIAVDSSGNIFISTNTVHRIRKVDTGGNIATIAGNGTQDFSGDGGLAVDASLDSPACVAIDSSGNLYIGDVGSGRIRMVAGE